MGKGEKDADRYDQNLKKKNLGDELKKEGRSENEKNKKNAIFFFFLVSDVKSV